MGEASARSVRLSAGGVVAEVEERLPALGLEPAPPNVPPGTSGGEDFVVEVGDGGEKRAHWQAAGAAFSEVEGRKREANRRRAYLSKKGTHGDDNSVLAPGSTKLFFSHCWRGQESQLIKRRLYSALTDDSNVFWADFLDLQAQGPVPWRNEIGTAIQTANKVVALIDKEYLLSFNCLEEMAYAIHLNKPLVLGILDQGAWDLLTIVNGHQNAWKESPAVGCRPLWEYEGQLFGPAKQPFSLRAVQEIFTVLGSINFCPCRDLDINLTGVEGVSDRLCLFVAKDLDYTKEHAVLQSKADAWVENGRPKRLLLSGKAEVQAWEEWVKVAQKAGLFPQVSEIQEEFVSACVAANKRNLWLLKLAGGAIAVVIFLLMIVSIVMAVIANDAAKDAQLQAEYALHQERVAAAMLLSIDDNPLTTAQSRAMRRAAEIAAFISYPNLVAPRLLTATTYLASASFWFFHISNHHARVQSVDFSPDGFSIASAGYDGHVVLQPLPRKGQEGFEDVAFIPIEANTTSLSCTVPGSEAMKVRWSLNGMRIAISCAAVEEDQHEIFVWEMGSDRNWEKISHNIGPIEIRAMAWRPNTDRQILALGEEDNSLYIWDTDTVTEVSYARVTVDVEMGSTRALSWHPSGSFLASSGTKDKIFIWEVCEDLSLPLLLVAVSSGPIDDDINALSFSADGSLLASAGDDNFVIVWDTAEAISSGGSPEAPAQLVALQVLPPHGGPVYGVVWTPSNQLLSAGHDNLVRKYHPSEAANGTLAAPFTVAWESQGQYGKINDLAVSTGEPLLIAAPSHSNMVSFYQEASDLGTKGPEKFKMNCSQELLDAYGWEKDVETRASAWTRDGLTFAVSDRKGHVCVWERNGSVWEVTGALLAPGDEPTIRVTSFSPSGQWLGIGDDDSFVTVWQRNTTGGWAGPWQIGHNNLKTRTISWAPGDSALAFGSEGGTIGVWHNPSFGAGDWEILKEMEGEVKSVAFRQTLLDGCMVLAGGGTITGIQILATGCSGEDIPPAFFNYSVTISVMAWSSEGLLASGGFDGVILVHSFVPGEGGLQLLAELAGHEGNIQSVSWAPDTPELASSSVDNNVRFWALRGPLNSGNTVSTDTGEVLVSGWKADIVCETAAWIHTIPARLACGRETETGTGVLTIELENPFTWMMEYVLIHFEDYVRLLNGLTYGKMTSSDLQALGYQDIEDTVLDPEIDN